MHYAASGGVQIEYRVFGEGPRRARAILVGEQPGDEEDLADHPLVGPAGRLLDKADAQLCAHDVIGLVKDIPLGPCGLI